MLKTIVELIPACIMHYVQIFCIMLHYFKNVSNVGYRHTRRRRPQDGYLNSYICSIYKVKRLLAVCLLACVRRLKINETGVRRQVIEDSKSEAET